jgi:hypothetical protein
VRENRETNVSDDIAGVLFRDRNRIKEIADVLARYGFARLAGHAAALPTPDFALPLLLVWRIRISLP